MSQKPFNLPRFATTTGQVLEPSEAEKDAGWPRDFKVPADWWNWINRQAYVWLRYLAGVPSGNLIVRNPSAAARFQGNGTSDDRIYMVRVFEGAGDLKDIGGSENHDEWWIGGFIDGQTSQRWLRFPRGLGGSSHYVTDGLGFTPRHIYRDAGTGDYGAIGSLGAATIGSAVGVTSTDGETWVASTTPLAFSTTPAAYADNGLDVGAGSVIMMINTLGTAFTSTDMGDNWATAQTGGLLSTFFDEIYDLAYSSTLDAWCAVGEDASANTGVMTSVDDGVTWVAGTGIPTTAGRHFTGVTVLDDGNFLIVGGTERGPGVAGQGIMAISTAVTVFADVAVIPNVHRFARVAKQGSRVLAVAQQGFDTESSGQVSFSQTVTYDSFSEGASGSWQQSGMLTATPSPLDALGTFDPVLFQSPEFGDPDLGVAAGSVPALVMTAEETVFTIIRNDSDSEPTNMLVSELAHPTVGF